MDDTRLGHNKNLLPAMIIKLIVIVNKLSSSFHWLLAMNTAHGGAQLEEPSFVAAGVHFEWRLPFDTCIVHVSYRSISYRAVSFDRRR